MNERELFLQALDMVDADARDQFLREACGDNQALYRDILALLDAHQQASGFLAQGHQGDKLDCPKSAEPTVGHLHHSSAGSLIAGRYKLLQQIGEGGMGAVWMADQKGIIHRDIKPSNILVESHDGKPVPKIIDFGLAKATSGMQLSENTLFTGFGSVLGTPLYMAPEQANFSRSREIRGSRNTSTCRLFRSEGTGS